MRDFLQLLFRWFSRFLRWFAPRWNWKRLRSYPPLAVSLLLHLGLLLLIAVVAQITPEKKLPERQRAPVIQAQLVDGKLLQQHEERKRRKIAAVKAAERAAEKRKKAQQEAKRRKVAAEKKRKAEEKRRKKLEAQRLKEKQQKEKKRKEQEAKKAKQKKQEQEQKRKEKALQKKKLREKQAQEKKRKEEQKRKAEAEKKRKAKEKAAREKAERERRQRALDALNAEAAVESEALANDEYARALQREEDRIVGQIERKVRRVWRIPVGTPEGRSCSVNIRFMPDGEVVLVEVVRSSGNQVFDASVVKAVHKASPFPLPDSQELKPEFNPLTLTMVKE